MQVSDKDKAIIKALADGAGGLAPQFRHDFRVSQKILGMLLLDKNFLIQSLDLVKPEYFEDLGHQLICSVLFDYFKNYNDIPSRVIVENEIRERRKQPDQALLCLAELDAVIADHVPGVAAREYLLDNIVVFAKEQACKLGVSRTIDLIERGGQERWSKIWELWREVQRTDRGHDLGLDYFRTLDERYDREAAARDAKEEVFTTGFDSVNKLLTAKGLCRGECAAFVGLSGSGKSIALVNAAFKNLALGKRVCYITLEMAQDKIARRFDALLANEPFAMLVDNREHVVTSIKQLMAHEEDQWRLQIKHYPGGTADTNTIRAYLSQLALAGFKPDLLVVDYVGEMKDIPGIKVYESRQLLVRDLRTIAQEEQICVMTALQANKKGREVQDYDGVIDDDAIADAFGQARPLDAIYSLNKPESACPLGSIFIIKHRDGKGRVEVKYEMDEGTLLMSEIPKALFDAKMAEFRKNKANRASDNMKEYVIE